MSAVPYHDLADRCARIDKRTTRYRFDLDEDMAWSKLDAPGVYGGPRLLEGLGFHLQPLADPAAQALFQWAFALSTCRAFALAEGTIVSFVADEATSLGPTRSATLLYEEEVKHIELFKRYGQWLERARPADVADFERAFKPIARSHHQNKCQLVDARSAHYPNKAIHHYVFWLSTIFVEEFTIYLYERLLLESDLIQPAWLNVHALHRREEIQHVVTDVEHIEASALSRDERYTWSRLFSLGLARDITHIVGLTAPAALIAARFPALPPLLGGQATQNGNGVFRDLLMAPEFRRTRHAAPYLEERAALEH